MRHRVLGGITLCITLATLSGREVAAQDGTCEVAGWVVVSSRSTMVETHEDLDGFFPV